jgi:hypothetical protein
MNALTGSDLENGFLNRCLVISAQATKRQKRPERTEVPAELKATLSGLYRWGNVRTDGMEESQLNDPQLDEKPHRLEWENDEAERVFDALCNHIEERMNADDDARHFLARTVEIAVRLATIRAAGRKSETVGMKDMEWGRDIALICGEQLAKEAKARMAVNDRQAWRNRLLALIKRKGKASRRDLQQAVRSEIDSRTIAGILDDLTVEGEVEPIADPNWKGGPRKTVAYRYVGGK